MDDDWERGPLMHRTVTRPANHDGRRVVLWQFDWVCDRVERVSLALRWLEQPLETEMNGRLKRGGTEKSRRHTHDEQFPENRFITLDRDRSHRVLCPSASRGEE